MSDKAMSYEDLNGTKTTVWRLKDGHFSISIRQRSGSSQSSVIPADWAGRLAEMLRGEEKND